MAAVMCGVRACCPGLLPSLRGETWRPQHSSVPACASRADRASIAFSSLDSASPGVVDDVGWWGQWWMLKYSRRLLVRCNHTRLIMYTTTVKCIIDLELHHITAPRFGLSQRIAAGTGLEFGPKVEGGWRSSCGLGRQEVSAAAAVLQAAWPSPSPRTSRSRQEEGSSPTMDRACHPAHPTRKVLSSSLPRLADGQRPRVPEGPLPLSDPPVPQRCPRLLLRRRRHPDSRLPLPPLLRQHALFALPAAQRLNLPAFVRLSATRSKIKVTSSHTPSLARPFVPPRTAALNDISTCSLPADGCFVLSCLRGKHHPHRSHKPDETPVIVPHEASATPAALQSFLIGRPGP